MRINFFSFFLTRRALSCLRNYIPTTTSILHTVVTTYDVCTTTILRTATYNYLPTITNLLLPSIAGSNLHQVFYSFKLFGVPSYNVDRAVEGIDPLYKAVLRSALFTEQIF